jgi:hypothetical protein
MADRNATPLLLVTGADHKTGQANRYKGSWAWLEAFARREFRARGQLHLLTPLNPR